MNHKVKIVISVLVALVLIWYISYLRTVKSIELNNGECINDSVSLIRYCAKNTTCTVIQPIINVTNCVGMFSGLLNYTAICPDIQKVIDNVTSMNQMCYTCIHDTVNVSVSYIDLLQDYFNESLMTIQCKADMQVCTDRSNRYSSDKDQCIVDKSNLQTTCDKQISDTKNNQGYYIIGALIGGAVLMYLAKKVLPNIEKAGQTREGRTGL